MLTGWVEDFLASLREVFVVHRGSDSGKPGSGAKPLLTLIQHKHVIQDGPATNFARPGVARSEGGFGRRGHDKLSAANFLHGRRSEGPPARHAGCRGSIVLPTIRGATMSAGLARWFGQARHRLNVLSVAMVIVGVATIGAGTASGAASAKQEGQDPIALFSAMMPVFSSPRFRP